MYIYIYEFLKIYMYVIHFLYATYKYPVSRHVAVAVAVSVSHF